MKIHIDVKDEEENVLFCSTSLSIEEAESELGRLERMLANKKEPVADF